MQVYLKSLMERRDKGMEVKIPMMYLPMGGFVIWVVIVIAAYILAAVGAIKYNPKEYEEIDVD